MRRKNLRDLKSGVKLEGFTTEQENVRRKHVGEYYYLLQDSIEAYSKGEDSHKDIENIQDFLDRCEILKEELTVVDERGDNYPANYFAVMPMPPYAFYVTLQKLEESGCLSKEQKTLLSEVSSVMRGIFPRNSSYRIYPSNLSPRSILSGHRGKTTYKGATTDFSSDEAFDKFVEKVEKILEEHHLPKWEVCVSTIGREFAKGKENPICLKNPVQQKQVERYKNVAENTSSELSESAIKLDQGKVK